MNDKHNYPTYLSPTFLLWAFFSPSFFRDFYPHYKFKPEMKHIQGQERCSADECILNDAHVSWYKWHYLFTYVKKPTCV